MGIEEPVFERWEWGLYGCILVLWLLLQAFVLN